MKNLFQQYCALRGHRVLALVALVAGGVFFAAPVWAAGTTNNASTAASTSTLVSTNNSSAITTVNMEMLDDKHKLAIGDRLSFKIIEDEPEELKELSVMDSGELEVPYIGRWTAVGKTCKEVAHQIKAELEKEHYYHATVIVAVDVMTHSRGKVYLVGAVRMAGPEEIPSDEVFTLSKAILRAGGFGDYADKTNVRVTRKSPTPGGQEQVFIVNVGEILDKGKPDKDIVLESDDLIFVRERIVRF